MLFWVGVSTIAPQWNVWGFMQDQPLAMLYAIIVFISLVLTKDKLRFKWRPEVLFLLLLIVCIAFSMMFAVNPDEGFRKWTYIMKAMLLVLAAIYALNTRRHVEALAAILAITVGVYGVKGGIFAVATGGEYIVHGPNPSWENNGWAIMVILSIPLIVYFLLQARSRLWKWCLAGAVLLATLSVLASFSRGGFLSIMAMFGFLWWKSNRKVLSLVLLLPLMAFTVFFMPEKWDARMETIQHYQADGSAMGRINAWKMLFNAANDHPLVGLGPYPYIPEVFSRYAPNPEDIHSAHSMYFEVLGENGYPALLCFLLMWFYTWRDASWIVKASRGKDDLRWAGRLSTMVQASLVGHFVGGTFLANGYFEPVYYFFVLIVVLHDIVARQIAAEASVSTARTASPAARPRVRVG